MRAAPILSAVLGSDLNAWAGKVGALTGKARTGLLHHAVSAVVPTILRAGFSSNAALSLLQQYGLGIRRVTFLARTHTERQLIAGEQWAKEQVPGEPLNVATIPHTDFPWEDQYTVKVKVYYRDAETGRFANRHITVGFFPGEDQRAVFRKLDDSIELWQAAGDYEDVGDVFSYEIVGGNTPE